MTSTGAVELQTAEKRRANDVSPSSAVIPPQVKLACRVDNGVALASATLAIIQRSLSYHSSAFEHIVGASARASRGSFACNMIRFVGVSFIDVMAIFPSTGSTCAAADPHLPGTHQSDDAEG
jgi:hypothetical protein